MISLFHYSHKEEKYGQPKRIYRREQTIIAYRVMQKNFVYFLLIYIEKALDEMSEKGLIGVPVLDDSMRPVGYMSERECLKVAMRLRYHNSQAAHVGDYMGDTVITLPHTMSVSCDGGIL